MKTQMDHLITILERSEWDPNQDKLRIQRQNILSHACQTVPFYQKQYSRNAELTDFNVLTRQQLQAQNLNDKRSNQIPDSHGALHTQVTSGSTGVPVEITGTDFTRLFYDYLMLREHAWHKRDFSKKLATIRWAKRGFAEAPNVHVQSTWGPPINQYKKTGSSIFINIASTTAAQANALLSHKPSYINSYPSQLAALAEYCLRNKISFPFLEEVRTTGETFNNHYLSIIQEAWPLAKVCDVYSCVEMGILAQQCPEERNYHVNIEHVILEIVDENNQTCPVGKTGKVLITSLLNYAQPLIRYEIGDYAQWGNPCACGRKLPVIKKILGRKRNRLRLSNGESIFPYLGEYEDVYQITTDVRKFQLIQHSLQNIEIKVVVEKRLTATQEASLKALMQKNLEGSYVFEMTYHDNILAGPNGKFEEFISLMVST